jgi:type IV pilus assembly protein PilM
MASARRVLTVDLGASTLKVAEFGIGRGGAMTLLRFAVAELGLDPNKEEDRGKFITPTLTKILKEHRIKTKDVALSISGQSVFMRFVKLPPVDATQVEQVVRFEAQQNVPFPIEEVTWDYQMMPNRGASSESEAVIVAIKKEVIEAEVQAVERAGVKIKQIDVAPFAVLNAFRYSEPQSDDCTLIIDMGARSTNLIFVEKNSFWIRNVPIAGNQISQAICNDMQEPFTAAEILKKGKGFVSLGGVYADPDDADAARISKLIRTAMTKLHVDMNRSIAYYRTTLGGGAPKRVFLTGGTSQLPYLDLFIADKLSLPVSYFNPLRNVALDPAVNNANLQQNSCFTAELVGLAARETGSCPAEVSLEAPTIASRLSKTRKQPFYVGALIAWILLFVCVALYYWQQIQIAEETAKTLNENADTLRNESPKIDKLAKDQTALLQVFNAVSAIGVQRDAWAQVLAALNDKMPDGIWITELVPEAVADPKGGGNSRGGVPVTGEIGALEIRGLYQAHPKTVVVDPTRLRDYVNALADVKLSDYDKSLPDQPLFDIDKNNLTSTLVSFTTSATAPLYFAQSFTLHLKLKTPIPLRPEETK